MTDTIYCDIAEFQNLVNDSYPYRWLAFRSNDGTFQDPHFLANLAWCKSAWDRGLIDGFIVYAVYEPDGGNWATTCMNEIGTPHDGMVVMIDVESWGGRISGDHSADINIGRARLAQWLGNNNRVIGYGNMGDLNGIWPNRGDAHVVLADYSGDPGFPGKIAHQYSDSGTVPPFGNPVDMNSADGLDSLSFAAALGIAPNPNDNNWHPFNPTISEDSMKHISSPNRGDALIGPGYFYQLTTAEEVQNCGAIVDASISGNDRQFDLWRAMALNGTVAAPAVPVTVDAAQVIAALQGPVSTAAQTGAQNGASQAVAGLELKAVVPPAA